MKASLILVALIAIVLMVVVDVDGAGVGRRNFRHFRHGGQQNQGSGTSVQNNNQVATTTSAAAAAAGTLSPPSNDLNNNICQNSNLPATGGQQIKTGSCSNTIQGEIPDVGNMVSSLIVSPGNGQTLPANQGFNVSVQTQNLDLGFFDNPDSQYYSFPQSLNNQGQIFGHQHVTIQQLNGNSPPDPQTFAFFKGLNDASGNGLLSVAVTNGANQGLPSGSYRICTMTGTFSHQPVIMPVAQRGAQDDCIRINVK